MSVTRSGRRAEYSSLEEWRRKYNLKEVSVSLSHCVIEGEGGVLVEEQVGDDWRVEEGAADGEESREQVPVRAVMMESVGVGGNVEEAVEVDVDKLKKENEELRGRLEETREVLKENEKLKGMLKKKMEENEALRKELEGIRTTEEENDKLKQKLEEFYEAMDKTAEWRQEMKDANAELVKKNEELRKQLEKKGVEVECLMKKVEKFRRVLEEEEIDAILGVEAEVREGALANAAQGLAASDAAIPAPEPEQTEEARLNFPAPENLESGAVSPPPLPVPEMGQDSSTSAPQRQLPSRSTSAKSSKSKENNPETENNRKSKPLQTRCSTSFKRTRPIPPISTPNTKRLPFVNAKRRPSSQKHAVDQDKLEYGWFCICSRSFQTQARLTEHLKYNTWDPKFPCKLCKVKYTSLRCLREHMITAHKKKDAFPPKAVGCGDCGQIFTSREEHKAHRLAEHPRWTERLRQQPHALDRSSNDKSIFRCLCGRQFEHQTNLLEHVRNYTNEADFCCRSCPSTFKTYARLRAHSLHIHKEVLHPTKQFGCGLCAQLFENRKALQQHMQDVHGVISHPSDKRNHGPKKTRSNSGYQECLCGKRFKSVKNRDVHVRRYELQKVRISFKCPHCPGQFAAHHRLVKHVKKVHDQKDFEGRGCTICGTTWGSSLELRRHQDNEHAEIRRKIKSSP